MKRITKRLSLLATSFLACGSLFATATLVGCSCATSDESVGKINYEYNESSDSYKVVGLDNAGEKIKSITVPETYKGKKVSYIKEGAFDGCPNLQNLTVPFVGSKSDATKEEGMIGWVFGNGTSSTKITTTWQDYIADDGEIVYGQYAIPSSLTNITITNAKQIPAGAFSRCQNLESIKFNKCQVTEIGNNAFYYCTGMFEFDFSTLQGLQTIGRQAFSNCYVLNGLSIPSTVNKIKSYAFANCISSAKTLIPKSTTIVGEYAFSNHIGGIILVEGKESELAGWDSNWTESSVAVVYDFNSSSKTIYVDDWLVIICGSGDNQYGYLAQWMGNWQQQTITIPAKLTYKGTTYNIKSIGGKCFLENTYIKKLKIEEGIEYIYPNTFQGCTSLEYANLPTTLKEVRADAFNGCSKLVGYLVNDTPVKKLQFGDNVTVIGDRAFKNCSSLLDIKFSSTLKTIGSEAFAYCTHLAGDYEQEEELDRNITIPNSCTSLGEGAFKFCFKYAPPGYTDSYYYPRVVLSNQITEIPVSCFESCGVRVLKPTTGEDAGTVYPKYVRVHMNLNDAPLTLIDDAAFKNCWIANLKNARKTQIRRIGNYAFYYAQPTSDLDKPGGQQDLQMDQEMEEIGEYAFYGCSTIKSLTFNTSKDSNGVKVDEGYNSLKRLGQYAFYGCNNTDFTEVDLSPCVNLITDYDDSKEHPERSARYAFAGCTYLEKVKLPGYYRLNNSEPTQPYWDNEEAGKYFKQLPERMFENCSNLGKDGDRTPIYITKHCTTLRAYAFSGCSYLQKVYLQGDIDFYGSGLFKNNSSLTTIKKYVHGDTPSLKDVTFSSKLIRDRIGSDYYSSCYSLIDAPIPQVVNGSTDTYTNLNSSVYLNNTALTTFTVPKTVRNISNSTFQGCTNLQTFSFETLSEPLLFTYRTIGASAFSGCTSLKSIDFSNAKVTSLGNNCFANCTSLGTTGNDFVLPPNAISMGTKPFEGWDETKQKIYFTVKNVKAGKAPTGDFTLNGTSSWTFKLVGTIGSGTEYWTCDQCGNKNLHFVLKS